MLGFFDPLPTESDLCTLQNSCNLPYYICFFMTPLDPLMQTSYLESP